MFISLFIEETIFFFFFGEILRSNLIIYIELEQENLFFGKFWHHAKQIMRKSADLGLKRNYRVQFRVGLWSA